LKYTGDIISHKILKANLPTERVVGDHVYYVINNSGDLTGEIWINDNSGQLICCAKDFTDQINILNGIAFKKATTISDSTMSLNDESARVHGNYVSVFNNAPFNGRTFLSVYEHSPTTNIQILFGTLGYAHRNVAKTGDVSTVKWNVLATTDKIDTLWTGSASSGDITLSASIESYNEVIMYVGKSGVYYSQQCSMLAPLYPANIGYSSALVANYYAGAFILIPKTIVAGNLVYTIQTNPSTSNIFSVRGVKRGSV
jgi:hypothetical protein